MTEERKALYKLYQSIAYGYILKNYSTSFINRVKDKIKVMFVEQKRGIVQINCKHTGNEFRLDINLKKKSINHYGCYADNRGYDNKALIEYNVNKIYQISHE